MGGGLGGWSKEEWVWTLGLEESSLTVVGNAGNGAGAERADLQIGQPERGRGQESENCSQLEHQGRGGLGVV